MEEEAPEFRHACKFCNKSFPCGRSLGGHMRSHVTNNSAETEEKHDKKLSSANNGGSGTCFEAGLPQLGYGLRENPRKTWRFADSSTEETASLLESKFCKECGKGFQSWKALFGHMKRHSEKERASINDNNNNSLEEHDSWTSANNNNQKQQQQQEQLVMDSQSDNETTTPNRRRRSQRRSTRYMGTTNSSSFSVVHNGSSSVSEIEQEQEEVAMCLMMLSRDYGGGGSGLKSLAESSDNFSESTKSPCNNIAAKTYGTNGSLLLKSKKLNAKTNEAVKLDSGVSKFWSGIDKTQVSIDGFFKKEKIKKNKKQQVQKDERFGFVDAEAKWEKEDSEFDQLGSKKLTINSSKRKLRDDIASYDDPPELRSDSLKKKSMAADVSDKRNKFECTTCNKTFHSYQALGGHRASHKKTKGCFVSTIESSENSIATEISLEPTTADNNDDNDDKSLIGHDITAVIDRRTAEREPERNSVSKTKSKGHECLICLKVFASGQALGGHKRSHLVGAAADAKNSQTMVIEKPNTSIAGIRDLIDLNLPAPDEEDSSNGGHVAAASASSSLQPWWAGSSHKHEALVGLISN